MAKEAMIIFLAAMMAVKFHSGIKWFEVPCARKHGYVIEHAGNRYCVKGNKIISWQMKVRR